MGDATRRAATDSRVCEPSLQNAPPVMCSERLISRPHARNARRLSGVLCCTSSDVQRHESFGTSEPPMRPKCPFASLRRSRIVEAHYQYCTHASDVHTKSAGRCVQRQRRRPQTACTWCTRRRTSRSNSRVLRRCSRPLRAPAVGASSPRPPPRRRRHIRYERVYIIVCCCVVVVVVLQK